MNVDEGYFVCADLSLIAISRRTLTLASSNIVQTACPDISNAYDLALFLEDKIAGCADLMGHLLQSSKELPIK